MPKTNTRTRKRKRNNEDSVVGDNLISISGSESGTTANFNIQTSTSPYFNGQSVLTHHSMSIRLGAAFFTSVSCVDLAKRLLGQKLVRKLDSGEILKGKIVETECYLGADDEASHSYKGKQTERNSAMFMAPGTAYVYNIYGMYCCFNISSNGEGAAVLIRSLQPLEGLDTMRKHREANLKTEGRTIKDKNLANGPSKLCQAMAINKNTLNKEYLVDSQTLWLESGEQVQESYIVKSKRIGISYAGTWAEKLLRFYVLGNDYISVRDRLAESLMNNNDA